MDKSNVQSPERDYKLITKLHEGKIIAKVICDGPSEQIYSWEAEITSLSGLSQILANFFESLEDLFEHIQDKSNLRVDCETGIMSILLKTTIRNKESFSEIAKIKMQPGKVADVRSMNLDNIVEICNSDEELSNKMIKTFFKMIAQQVSTTFQESRLDEILNPFVNKFKLMGEENENIQRKFGGMITQIAQLKEQTARELISVSLQTKTSYRELKDYIETVKEGIDREIIRYENKNQAMSFEFKDRLQRTIDQLKDSGLAVTKLKQQITAIDQQIYDMERELYRKNEEGFKLYDRDQNFMDPSLPYYKLFNVEGNKIIKKASTGCYSMLIGKYNFERKSKFSVKILKWSEPIYIGVLQGKHKMQQYCQKSDSRAWFSNEGIIFDGERQKRAGIKLDGNLIVEVTVNIKAGTITWRAGEQAVTIEYKALKNKGSEWFPCVWMAIGGDAIELKKNQ